MDRRFDHRSCDYWEDGVRGSKAARPSWWRDEPAERAPRKPRPDPSNPFASAGTQDEDFNPFAATAIAAALDPMAGDDLFATPASNPFAPTPRSSDEALHGPRKLRLLNRGRAVFGSYAKVALVDSEPVAYAQFGPLSAYPRAQQIRDLYPRLPQSPLPAVITCIATVGEGFGKGLALSLIDAVVDDLAERGFAAIESYPDLTLSAEEASAAHPSFWVQCGFSVAAEDERYPVMRRELA